MNVTQVMFVSIGMQFLAKWTQSSSLAEGRTTSQKMWHSKSMEFCIEDTKNYLTRMEMGGFPLQRTCSMQDCIWILVSTCVMFIFFILMFKFKYHIPAVYLQSDTDLFKMDAVPEAMTLDYIGIHHLPIFQAVTKFSYQTAINKIGKGEQEAFTCW